MSNATCFDPGTLQDYLLGKLSDEESDAVAAHLEACLSCEATISQLDRASDTLTNGLRLPANSAEPATDDELQKALSALQTSEPFASVGFRSAKAEPFAEQKGTILRDYRLLEPLGSGGMGMVYKAVHTRLDRLVAVKLLPARRLGDEQAVARFQREMRVIGQLSHPAIVQATDAGEVDSTHFLVMEYVDGFDLNTIAKACGPLSIADACETARQAALGLEYAHQQGIVHRDIKPSNLMLSRELRDERREFIGHAVHSQLSSLDSRLSVKILDLGLALLSGEQAPIDELTTVGQLMGTLDYMAPEQLEDSHLVGPRADIYALAGTLYRLLTGAAPFAKEDRQTPLQKLRALATQMVPPIRERRADLPIELAAIIDRALHRDPTARFASMSDFAEQLTPWCVGHDLSRLTREASRFAVPAVGQVSDSARRGSPDPAVWLDCRSPSISSHSRNADAPRGDLRSGVTAGSGDPRRAPFHGSRRRARIATLLTIFGFITLGIVIAIQTNKGTLIVESVRDNVEVRVKKSGRIVEQLEVTAANKSFKLAAGEYEVDIVADGLQIDQQKFELMRGKEVVVRVTETPKVAAAIKPNDDDERLDKSHSGGARRKHPLVREEFNPISSPSDAAIPAEPDDEKPNPTAKSIDQFLAESSEQQAEAKYREAMRRKLDVDFTDTTLPDVVQFLQDKSQLPLWIDVPALAEEGIATDTPITQRLKEASLGTTLLLTLRPLQLTSYWDGTSVAITTMSKAKEKLINRSYPVGRSLPVVRKAVRLLNEQQAETREAMMKAINGAGKPTNPAPTSGGGFFALPTRMDSSLSPTSPLTGRLHFQFGGGGGFGRAGGKPIVPPEQTVVSYYENLLTLLTDASWMNSDGEGGTVSLLGDVLFVRQTRPAHEQVEAALRLLEQAAAGPLANSPVEIRRPDYPIEADRKVIAKLSENVSFDQLDVPLNDALAFLSDTTSIPVLLDIEKLTEEGIATDLPISLTLANQPLQVVLHRILDPLNLSAEVEEGLLLVTSRSAAQSRLVTRAYEVRDLLARGIDGNELLHSLQAGTAGPWHIVHGDGGKSQVFADRLLFVTQTRAMHDEVAAFLRDLDAKLGKQPPKKPGSGKPKSVAQADNGGFGGDGTTTPPTTTPDLNQPRYDGKTFDEWLAVLDVERSPARLADAVQALRLLHQNHQTATVAQRLLKLFRTADSSGTYGDSDKRRSLSTDVDELLAALPQGALETASIDELKNGNARSRKFVFYSVISQRRGSFDSENLARAVLQVSRDPDVTVRTAALRWLAQQPVRSWFPNVEAGLKARFREALTDNAPAAALSAVQGLLDSEPDTPLVTEALTRLIGLPTESTGFPTEAAQIQGEALKLAAIMGPRAAATAPMIAKLLQRRDTETTTRAVLNASMGPSGRSGFTLNFKQTAVLALARMGTSAAETLPILNELLLQQKSSPQDALGVGGFGGFGGSGGPGLALQMSSVSLTELLIAAKKRLESKPDDDPNVKPADANAVLSELKAEDVIAAVARYKLLLAERTLLEQHTPTLESSSLRELDQKLVDAEKEAAVAMSKYNSQRRTRGGSSPTGFSPFSPTTPPATKPASQPAALPKSDG